MNKAKKILYKSTLCVLIFLIVCTFLSKSIAAAILPAVEVINPFSMNFTVSDKYTGEAVYESVYEIKYDFQLHILNVFAEVGDSVNEGDLLIEADGREYYLEMRRRELNIIQLENMIEQSSDNDYTDRLKLQVEIEREDLLIYIEKYPTDGKIYAKAGGVIFNINAQAGEMINPGVNLIGVYDENSKSTVVFRLDEYEAQKYDVRDEVVILYDRNGIAETEVKSRVESKEYDEHSGAYIFSVLIIDEYMTHGQSVTLEITNRKEPYGRVIPYSAIIAGAENKYYVYLARQREGLFGLEYIVRLVEVEIQDTNNLYVALGGWNVMDFDDVVLYSSRRLTSGEVVRVINR